MQEAYKLALMARDAGEVPVGAVVVYNNHIIGHGSNKSQQTNDPTAHAEIVAIRAASKFLQNHRIPNTTLYVTLEPCCMCAGALMHARINRLVFATRDFKAGATGSICNMLRGIQIDEGILQEKCAFLLIDFF